MPKYKQYLAAMLNLATAAQENPKLASSLKESEGWSLDEAVKAYDGVLAYGMMQDLKISPDSAAKATKVSRANLSFYQQNDSEIQRLRKEAEAKAPILVQDEDEDE